MLSKSYSILAIVFIVVTGVITGPTNPCPADKPIVNCFASPCSVSECPGDPTAKCTDDYCGGCNAVWTTPSGKKPDCYPKETECPPDKPMVYCRVSPCRISTCPGDSNAICTDNYCGGCNAIWTTPNGQPAQCDVKTICPADKPIVYCFFRPCQISTCPGDPSAICTDNYCGGCHAVWTTPSGKPAMCKLKTTCPPGKSMVYCFVRPCQVSTCPGDPTAICTDDYCGGCNAIWTKPDGKPAQCNMNSKCPPCQSEVQCTKNPCDVSKCPAYPQAKCVPNYCGGCNTDWYVDGKKVECTMKG